MRICASIVMFPNATAGWLNLIFLTYIAGNPAMPKLNFLSSSPCFPKFYSTMQASRRSWLTLLFCTGLRRDQGGRGEVDEVLRASVGMRCKTAHSVVELIHQL